MIAAEYYAVIAWKSYFSLPFPCCQIRWLPHRVNPGSGVQLGAICHQWALLARAKTAEADSPVISRR